VGILVLLAAHGNVCNVQKEVGVSTAYSLVTDQAKLYHSKLTVEATLYRLLYTLREQLLEEVCQPQFGKGKSNTHILVEFRNTLAQDVGLKPIPDPDRGCVGHAKVSPQDKIAFFKKYSVEKVVHTVERAVNQTPRKLPYDLIVNWFQKNSLEEDEYEFLGQVFDTDTGLVKEEWIRFFLLKQFILSGPLPKSTPIRSDTPVAEPTKDDDKDNKDHEIHKEEEVGDIKSDGESSDEDIKSGNDDDSSPVGAPTFTRQVSEDSKLPQIIRQNSLLEQADLAGVENKDQKKNKYNYLNTCYLQLGH